MGHRAHFPLRVPPKVPGRYGVYKDLPGPNQISGQPVLRPGGLDL